MPTATPILWYRPARWARPPHGPPTLRRQAGVLVLSGLFAGSIAVADVITGPHIHMGQLYLLPVLAATWFAGRWHGYAVSVLASVLWVFYSLSTVEQIRPDRDFFVTLFIRLIFYTAVIELLIRLRDSERRLERAVADRTAELNVEVADREKAQKTLRQLAAQLSAAEDAERRRIAYDIHDALSQMLGVVKLNLETTVAETAIDTRQYVRLVDVVSVVDDLIRQTRGLTFDLHPSMLDHFGLGPTLNRFAEEYQRRTMAEVGVSDVGEPAKLPMPLASYLFRAVKEVVSNSVKHGNAKLIIVTLHWLGDRLRIVVDDDGSGFDVSAARAPRVGRGLGLAGMDERLTSLGGRLRLESQPGTGARVVLEVPVHPPA